jgi:hypothetical protein
MDRDLSKTNMLEACLELHLRKGAPIPIGMKNWQEYRRGASARPCNPDLTTAWQKIQALAFPD